MGLRVDEGGRVWLPSSLLRIYVGYLRGGVKTPGIQEIVKLGERIQLKGRILGFFQKRLGIRDFGRKKGLERHKGGGRRGIILVYLL